MCNIKLIVIKSHQMFYNNFCFKNVLAAFYDSYFILVFKTTLKGFYIRCELLKFKK